MKNNQEFQIIGLDIGRGYVKAYSEFENMTKQCIFKSVVGLGRSMNFENYKDPIYIEVDGEDYFAGILAENEADNPIQNLKDDKTSLVAKKLLYAALNKVAISENVKIMIGVPNKLFKKSVLLEIQKEYKDTSVKIKDKITGAYKNINIIDVSIYREADAALLWHVRKCSEFDNDLCMVTVGFRTTEIGTYNNKMKFNDKLSKSIELGNKTALEYVQRKIKDDDNVMRSLSEIDSSDRYDSLKKVAYNNLSEKISQEIEGLLINLSEYDVFIGGGTSLNMNFDGYDVIPDAQMATAKGLFTVGNKVFK
ncbi:ParM/StbA family protein [Clostridium butyricum]